MGSLAKWDETYLTGFCEVLGEVGGHSFTHLTKSYESELVLIVNLYLAVHRGRGVL